jgi:PPOX class probable F420-dependent enzyme
VSPLHESVRAVLAEGRHLAHLVTLNADGSPQISVVWAALDGDQIVTAHLSAGQKVRNVRRDPRVALSMETGPGGPSGLAPYLVVHGRARVQDGGAAELLGRMARTYLGPDVRFPPGEDHPPGYVLRITVERVGGVGPWAEDR